MPGETLTDPIAESVAALALTPAGPALAAALAALDLAALTGSQCVDVLKAQYRQDSHERGRLFAAITEVMRRTEAESVIPDDVWPVEFAADEVRAALVLTRRAAEGLCALAEDVVRRLPEVQHAFAAGLIDQPRVRVFSLWTCGLSDAHTEAIVAALLPRAHQLTTAQLIHEIQRHAIALDPTWARRRYERALRGRRVVGSRNSEGTANLSGYDLPVERVAAACDRFDRLAKAAKQAGHPDPIDHIRSYLFLGLTDGTYEGLIDPQILARLLAEADLSTPASPKPTADTSTMDTPAGTGRADTTDPGSADSEDADSEDADSEDADSEDADTEDADTEDADTEDVDIRPADGDARPADEEGARPAEDEGGRPDDEEGAQPADDNAERAEAGDDDAERDGAADDYAGADESPGASGRGGYDPAAGGPGPARVGAVGRSSGLRLLVGLATLAGADDRPGELIGWGPVHAELARVIATAPGASWWYVLTGPGGIPLAIGQVRSRPASADRFGRGYPGLQVWLQVDPASLNALSGRSHPPGWDRVIAEIAGKSECDTGPPKGDPARRLPGAELRRWLEARDRTCAFPGCRVPAHRSDADHSIEYAHGGPTTDTNLGPSCRHDHRLRHEGGWKVTHTEPGHFTWTSRLGHTYHRHPPPDVTDLPEPMPTPDTADEDADDYLQPSTQDWRTNTCMQPEPRQPPVPPPPPPPPPRPEDDPPPF